MNKLNESHGDIKMPLMANFINHALNFFRSHFVVEAEGKGHIYSFRWIDDEVFFSKFLFAFRCIRTRVLRTNGREK